MGKGNISQINSVCVCVHKLTNRGKRSYFQKEKNKDYVSLDMVWKIMKVPCEMQRVKQEVFKPKEQSVQRPCGRWETWPIALGD